MNGKQVGAGEAPTEDPITLGFGGQIIEVGLSEHGNEVVIQMAKDQCVRIRGISTTLAKAFARHLYEHCAVRAEVLT